METKDIICELNKLDLSKYPYFRTKELIREFKRIGFIIFTLHPGKIITRARPNADLKTVSDLAYKPQEHNNSCQRASTPNKTILYGCIVPEGQSYEATRFISACECSKLLRSGKESKGRQAISYGKWEVLEDIHLLTIIHKDSFKDADNSLLSELKRVYEEHIKRTPDIEEDVDSISKFLAKEFSKENTENKDYNYLISAIFSEIAIEDYGYDGVMYPSVQAGGQLGFNVAITPSSVDSKMKLILVYETTLFKNKEKARIVGERIGHIQDNATIVFEVRKDYSENEVSEYIQIRSLDDLEEVK